MDGEPRITASELVMKVLEGFSESEACDLIIIFNDRDGNISKFANVDSLHRQLGLLEMAKAMLLSRVKTNFEDKDK